MFIKFDRCFVTRGLWRYKAAFLTLVITAPVTILDHRLVSFDNLISELFSNLDSGSYNRRSTRAT
jgi:hypothetical protein